MSGHKSMKIYLISLPVPTGTQTQPPLSWGPHPHPGQHPAPPMDKPLPFRGCHLCHRELLLLSCGPGRTCRPALQVWAL